MMKVCLLGASGSIGKQTLQVMNKNKEKFDLVSFSVGKKVSNIANILEKYPSVKYICVKDKKNAGKIQKAYPNITIFSGDDGLIELIKHSEPDMVVNALVGFVGLAPTLESLKENKILCLANKESLVVGGELVNDLLNKGFGKLIPIDSEHVAILKCLSVSNDKIDKVIITASGGAFRNLERKDLKNVKAADALKHPNWKMGKKITIDSATMVNKTFEIIEAHYLFGLPINKVDVILNSNSFVHSLIKYKDGNYRYDYGKPDMRVPIKYAIFEGLLPFKTYYCSDLSTIKKTSFKDFSKKRFPVVKHAKTVINSKGTYGTVLNAANEVAVNAFLENKIKFLDIEKIVDIMMENHHNINHPTFEDIVKVDNETRQIVNSMIMKGAL